MHNSLQRLIKMSLGAMLIGSTFSSPVNAETSEWIDGGKLNRLMKKISRGNKNIATRISCKVGPGKAQSNKGTLFKVTYKPNAEDKNWLWAWGNQSGNFGAKARSQGYKQVSGNSFKRDTGLVTKCAIWHE